MAFADTFNVNFSINYDLQSIVGTSVPLSMMTNSLSLFDVPAKATERTEKRLMIDLKTIKDSYQKHELQQVAFIRSENNPADALAKIKQSSILDSISQTSEVNHAVEQWIKRMIKKIGYSAVKDSEC